MKLPLTETAIKALDYMKSFDRIDISLNLETDGVLVTKTIVIQKNDIPEWILYRFDDLLCSVLSKNKL
jgi:hypothetical protein